LASGQIRTLGKQVELVVQVLELVEWVERVVLARELMVLVELELDRMV